MLNADLVTDTSTLWSIIKTVYEKVKGRTLPKKDTGITLTVQIEHGTTFLKVINDYVVDEEALAEATARLKHARQGHPAIRAGPDRVREPLNVSRRVLSYGFGDLSLIVEDDNRISTAMQVPGEVSRDCFVFKDGWW